MGRGLFQEKALIGDAVIADIGEHYDAVFTVYAFVLKDILIEHILRLFKTTPYSSSSSCFNFIQFGKGLFHVQITYPSLLYYDLCIILKGYQAE